MGRQILFHMLNTDCDEFLKFVQERDPVVVTLRDSDSPEIRPARDADIAAGRTLCLWNRKLLPHLERKWIPAGCYGVDGLYTPTLEFTPSFSATWENRPALVQGRLFGDFDDYLDKPVEFKKWYERLVRWIRTNYRKNPAGTAGYVGPAAFEFYDKGGHLAQFQFIPPPWVVEFRRQLK